MNDYMEFREEVCKIAKKMWEAGFVTGSSGNIGMRVPDEENRYVINPTSIPYEEMCPEQVVVVDGEGDLMVEVDYDPSVETPMHTAIFKARPDVGAIIHSHAIYSTILAVIRKPIPALIEEFVIYAGGEVIVAEYAAAGSNDLARFAVKALGQNSAILLANHGNLCTGKNLKKAFNLCALVEKSAKIYVETLKLGGIHKLPEEVMEAKKEMYKLMRDS